MGEVGKARSGIGFPDIEQGGVSGIPFFKVSDMNTDGNENEMIVANNYVSPAQITAHKWTPISELPAIFFAKVGAAVMLNRKRLCRFPFLLDNNTMAYSLNADSWDSDFAKSLFETVDLTKLVQVGALPSYNSGDIEDMEIMLPDLVEQRRIGTYFKELDNLITLHQREQDVSAGSTILINGKNNTSTWEQRKFGEMADYKKGPFGSALKKEIFVPESIESVKVYEQQNAIKKDWKLSRYFITKKYAEDLNAFETHGGDIIISCAGTIGEMYELPEDSAPGVINQALMRVRINSNLVDKSFYQILFLNMIDDFSKEHSNGSAMKNIPPFADLKPMEVLIPKMEEQKKITAFYTNLDNLITLHQRKQ